MKQNHTRGKSALSMTKSKIGNESPTNSKMKNLFGSTMTSNQLRMAEKGNRERLGRILAKHNFHNIVQHQTEMNP